ncbi:teichoic acids export ATP-binding protein TagH [Oceanobacillus neutriphilus]|uniref:Teichoic acids export ATP-binding protein TagH n=2 Tax=Oceanobacillus neutriphilus TaxID=531815 RepID=A0ABQ2NTJ5_9BACI|nr:teichoic acids export ATP-binding protein TagH [Oceanobacillus neutriphilus]
MTMEKAIKVKNVSKKYKLYSGNKERFLDLVTPKSYGKDFYALTNVNFEAEKGDIVGFIGINGSGKSTLSNIIAGILPETTGFVKLNGEAALIAVASGLKGDLTGRDNIELKLLMLGFNKNEIKQLEPEIIEFAELETFIDQPVKSYSSGMKSRLGFAISVNINPDILIIDEALSVGDKAFAEKSLEKMREFKKRGKTMIFVSHSLGQMKEFCEKILWLEYGVVKDYGTTDEVLPKYEQFLKQWKKMSNKERKKYRNDKITENMKQFQSRAFIYGQRRRKW